jgi:hypothetical protein
MHPAESIYFISGEKKPKKKKREKNKEKDEKRGRNFHNIHRKTSNSCALSMF